MRTYTHAMTQSLHKQEVLSFFRLQIFVVIEIRVISSKRPANTLLYTAKYS